jgi:hypothetical protein
LATLSAATSRDVEARFVAVVTETPRAAHAHPGVGLSR